MNPADKALASKFEDQMNSTLKTAFNNTLDTARKNLETFGNQKDLAQGFANANAYSTQSATLQGYQNYDLFALSSGLMVGVQAPSARIDYYSHIADDIQKRGDLYLGLGAGVTFLNVGINAKFIKPGLYLNVKYGAFKMKLEDLKMDFNMMGIGFNYKLLEPKSFVGLVKWRGISLGSGFYQQTNKLNVHINADTINTKVPFRETVMATATDPVDSVVKAGLMDGLGYTTTNPNSKIILNPSFNMGLDVRTYTIPFDAVTAVSVLFGTINLSTGVGFDLNFGSNKIVLKGETDAAITSDTTRIRFTPAHVNIDGSSSKGPTLARFRAMAGVGLGLGPVKIDVPLIYYAASGLAFGVTAAIVW